MAQATAASLPRSGRDTSFLSFDDAPNSPNAANLTDGYATPSNTAGPSERNHIVSPGSPKRGPAPNRASPSRVSRLIRSRPGSSKDLSAAASSDTQDSYDSLPSIRPNSERVASKQPVSRGSRLGALLGRTLPTNNQASARNGSSSASQTENVQTNDAGLFDRRHRYNATAANSDAHDTSSLAAPPLIPSSDEARHISATGRLDPTLDPSSVATKAATYDSRGNIERPPRRSSQSNQLESHADPSSNRDSASAGSTSSTAPQQSRAGRLGRLAYKKDDSISFIAQSRTAPQQSSFDANDQNHNNHPWTASSRLAAGGATRGLGIEDVSGPYASQRSSNSSFTAAGYPSSRYGDAEYYGAFQHPVGVASTALDSHTTHSSSNGLSRAPSVGGTRAADYHNRFSRQGLSQELEQDLSQDSEARASRSSSEVQGGLPMMSGSSNDRSSRSPRGTLSDAAIAQLGAMPGASAGSLLNSNGAPLSSKNILTIALQKAQNAVQLDSANNVPEAIAAYQQAVRLLEEVMERIAPRSNKRSRPSREEERRRLRVIHDTYADRIRLLSMIYSPDIDTRSQNDDRDFASDQPQTASRGDWLAQMRGDSQHSPMMATPRMHEDSLVPDTQRSPDADTQSFLSITPGRSAFPASVRDPASPPPQSSQSQHPFPKSPPVHNAPLSPVAGVNTSPRRRLLEHARPSSRESRGSRASVSLSIADEQEAQSYRIPPPVIDEEMPRISVEGVLSLMLEQEYSSPKKGLNRDAVTKVREADALAQQHVRSDSDSSFKSVNTPSRLKPAANLPNRAFGLDDEVRTPNTAYFDASVDSGHAHGLRTESVSPADPTARQQQQQQLPTPTSQPPPPVETPAVERSVEKPPKMGLAQRARALSFKGPLLRQKASMPSLGERKNNDPLPAVPTVRPEFAATPTSEIASPWDEVPGSNPTSRPGSTRPRASTSAALVSASTAAGTISQRRKNAQNEDRVVQGLSDELEELGLMEEAGSADSVRAKSGRQRSTSQPGSRRPSIPAAFLSDASALPANGEGVSPSGEGPPPPVPDLARTLSALELKRGSNEQALSKAADADAGNGEVPTSTLAMPLPRPPAHEADASSASSTFLITDIFPTGLPSLAAGHASYASTPLSKPPSLSPHLPRYPAHSLLRPFYTLHLLRLSILSGCQLTPSLYLSRSTWRQTGSKLVGIDAKMRAIELLLAGVDAVERDGEAMLMPLGSGAGLETSSGNRFSRVLEEWEGVMGDVGGMLGKKLPFLDASKDKSRIGGLSSRFTRGLDRMTGAVAQGKTVDGASMSSYIDALARLFAKTGVLATHLRWVLVAEGSLPPPPQTPTAGDGAMPSPTGIGIAHAGRNAYFAIPTPMREELKARLKKSSDFMGRVVLVWVLQDVGVLVERRVKKGVGLFGD